MRFSQNILLNIIRKLCWFTKKFVTLTKQQSQHCLVIVSNIFVSKYLLNYFVIITKDFVTGTELFFRCGLVIKNQNDWRATFGDLQVAMYQNCDLLIATQNKLLIIINVIATTVFDFCSVRLVTRGVQKVRRPTQLTTRYAHHILSLVNIDTCN